MTVTPEGDAGLILAGGMGRRWGGPKAWARLADGRSFLEACAAALRAAGASPLLATLPPDADPPKAPPCPILRLPTPELDMFSSLRCGLEALLDSGDWRMVAILPVDHPLVRPASVRRLLEAGPPAAVPRFDGKHGHPVTLDRRTAEAIVAGVLAGPTLRDVLRAVTSHEVVVDDPGVRHNCNTPQVLQRAQR